ncbi:hypothetical protein AYI69_g8418, partial [Smittium culicis]
PSVLHLLPILALFPICQLRQLRPQHSSPHLLPLRAISPPPSFRPHHHLRLSFLVNHTPFVPPLFPSSPRPLPHLPFRLLGTLCPFSHHLRHHSLSGLLYPSPPPSSSSFYLPCRSDNIFIACHLHLLFYFFFIVLTLLPIFFHIKFLARVDRRL